MSKRYIIRVCVYNGVSCTRQSVWLSKSERTLGRLSLALSLAGFDNSGLAETSIVNSNTSTILTQCIQFFGYFYLFIHLLKFVARISDECE